MSELERKTQSMMIGGSSHTLVTVQVPVTADLLNELQIIRIGELLKSMDIAACMSAERHSHCTSVTLSMDDVNFSDARAAIGDLLVIRSRVNRAFKTSMEVGLKVELERPESGTSKHLCSSYFVFVALNADGKKVEVPPMIPITDREKTRWALAADRRQIRLDQATIINRVIQDKNPGANLRYSLPGTRESIARFGEVDDNKNEVTQMVLPQHANHYGNTFGGQIMAWAVEAAEVAAARHARTPIVTVSVDDIFFLQPSKVGTRVVLKTSVNRVFNRSMEVGVRVEGHHLNGDIVLINRCYFTMVAIPSPSIKPSLAGSSDSGEQSKYPNKNLPTVSTKKSFFGSSKKQGKKETDEQTPQALVSSPSFTQIALRSVPLKTPDQIRRHEQALGRRRIRLERLQLKRSNHLAWPFTPETDPRNFTIENLRALERVALDDDVMEDERGTWGLVSESNGVFVWTKSSHHNGVSMKSQCEISAPFAAVIFAVFDVAARSKWDAAVAHCEIRHSYEQLHSDIIWLAVDMRAHDANSKPTDFSLLRSWKIEQNNFCIASHSVIHQSVPITKDCLRAETASSGFLVRNLGFGKVEVQYVLQLNPTSLVAHLMAIFWVR